MDKYTASPFTLYIKKPQFLFETEVFNVFAASKITYASREP